MSEFTEKLMNRAKELDSRPGLSSSYAPSRLPESSAAQSGSFAERLMSRARELDRQPKRQLTPSAPRWTSVGEARSALEGWESELNSLRSTLESRETALTATRERLGSLSGSIRTQQELEDYNALVDAYNTALGEYQSMAEQYDSVYGDYESGYADYRTLLSQQGEAAEKYRAEAAELTQRNEQLERDIRQFRATELPYIVSPSQSGDMERYMAMQAELEENQARIAELNSLAEEAQLNYYGSFQLSDDWAEKSAALGSQRTAQGMQGETPYYAGGAVYDYINDIDGAREQLRGYDSDGSRYEIYANLTPEEIGTYNYIYAEDGAEAAGQYLDFMREELNRRQGLENYENLSSLQRGLYWIPAGLDQFAAGIRQLFSDEPIAASPTQFTSARILEDLEDAPVRRTLYELGTTLTNMAPSILASAVGGWALGVAGVAAGTAGRIAGLGGSALLGASAAGNAYTQKVNEGYTEGEARLYSALVGASEGALSYLLGGISRLGGVSAERVAAKIAGLDNALGRIARTGAGNAVINTGLRMISEGTEEGLQELLAPAFATLITGEEYDGNFEDAAYAFLLGTLSAGVIEGVERGAGAVTGYRNRGNFTFEDLDGFVGENGVNYFEGINTLEELEARYRELARQNHPDVGGDTAVMAEINRQHSMARAWFQGQSQGTAGRSETRPQQPSAEDAAPGIVRRLTAGDVTAPQGGVSTDVPPVRPAAPEIIPAAEITPEGGIVLPTAEQAGGVMLPTAEQLIERTTAQNTTGGIDYGRAEAAERAELSGGDGGRYADQRTGGQAGQLEQGAEGRTAAAERGRAAIERQNRARNLRLEEVSARSLGIAEGTETENLRVLPEEAWDDELQSTAEEVYWRTGKAVQYVLGSIEVLDNAGDTHRVRGVWTPDGDIIIQADNMRVSARQIGEHESYHSIAAEHPGTDAEIERRIREQFGEEEFDAVVETYIQRLHGIVDMRANASGAEFEAALARVKQEIFADAYAGINAFGAHADRYRDTAREVVEERTRGEYRGEIEEATRDTTGPPDGRYSYAGVNAANADLEALSVAQSMEEQNVNPESIRLATGWFRGMDGKWRFEIDDSGMEYRRDGDANLRRESGYQRLAELTDKWEASMSGGEALTESERAEMDRLEKEYGERVFEEHYMLTDFIEHSRLYDNYPQLRNAGLIFDELPDGTNGYYNYRDGTIYLSNKFIGEPRDVLIHEIQHAIQRYEGFSRGTSPEYWARREYESGDLVEERLRRERDSVFNSLSRAEQNKYNRYRELDMALNQTMFAEPGTEEAAAYQRYEAEQDAIYEELYPNEWFKQLLDLERRVEDVPGEYARMYRNTAGEIEARDAAARRRLTAEERRATPPDLGDENTVFAEEGSGASWSLGSDTETASIKEQIENSRDELNAMEPVANAQVPENLTSKYQASRWAINELSRWGGRVDRQNFGNIYFSEKDIDHGVRYADTPAEKAALAVMPQVLKRGIEIGKHDIHKGRAKQTIMFAAPVVLNGTRGNMAVVINQRSNHYYAHRIVLPDGTTFVFGGNIEDAARELSRGVTENGSLARTTSAASDSSISDNGENVNSGYSTDDELPVKSRFSADEDEDVPEERRRRTTRPVAESRPIIASRELKRDIYTQFSIPPGERGEISRLLDGFTDKLIRTGELTEADRSELFDRLYAAGVMSVPADEYYGVGREAVINRRMYIDPSTRADFGDDWNNIRRRAFGAGIYLTSDTSDMAADQWNMELAETLPGLFDAGETDPRTIIERVIQVAEEGRDEQMSLAEYTSMLAEQEHISEDEILNEMERQLDWDLRTFARQANLEIKLRDRTGVKIAQERERYAESKNRARERRLAREAEDRARRKELAEKRRQDMELKQLQQRTLTQLRWLARNQNKAPADLRETWNEVLGDIDIFAVNAANEMRWSNKYQATWRDIADMVKAAKNDKSRYPNFFPSAELERIAARVDNDKIADMDIGALQDLYKAAVGLRTEFYNRNNVINDEKGRLFADLYAESKAEINSAPGEYSGNAADRLFNLEQLTPMNVLERMAGWNPDSAWYSMARQLEQGEINERDYVVRANELLEGFLREHEDWVIRSDGQGRDAVWYEIEVPELLELGFGDKPIFGDSVTVYMTPAQKVQLYLESKNYDNLRHMAGGRTFPDKELYSEGKRQEAFAQGRTIRLAPETVRHLVENLTEEEQQLAAILERYYNQFAAERINAVSNVLYGYDRAITRNYAPIYTNSNYNQKEIGRYDTTAEGVGNMKERVKGSQNPSYNISAYDAFEQHVDQTARFVGMAIPERNWNTLLNWQERNDSMSDVITHKWGQETLTYITDLLTELQGGAPRKQRFQLSSGMEKLWSNYISAIFGANPSIVIKQLGSIPLGGAYLGIGNRPSLAQLASIDRELIGKYTSELNWRLMGYSTPETRQLKEHPNWVQRNSFFRTVFGGGAITGMDGWAASTLWPWAENKVRKEYPELELGTPEQIEAGQSPFYKKVAQEFNDAVSRSQSMSDTLHNSSMRRANNPFLRPFTMFKSDSAQTYNTIRQKIGEAQYYKRVGAEGRAQRAARIAIGTAFLAFLLNAAWGSAVNFLINMWKYKGKNYRDDEDELTAESVIKAMVFDMIGSLGGVVVGGEETADIIGNIVSGERWYGIDTPGIEQLNNLLESIQNSGNSIKDLVSEAANIASQGGDVGQYFAEHSAEIINGVKEVAETFAMYVPGLPVSNVEAYVLGALRWISPELVTAYEDALSTPNKQGLDGLEGDALTTRVKDILLGRVAELSDEMAERLAKLYADGYTGVVPSSTPTQITVDGTSYELDAYAQQVYNNVWSDTMGASLDELIAAPEFRSANRAQQTSMIKKLYSYADATARDEVVDAYRPADWVAELDEDLAAGGSLSEWAIYDVLAGGMSGTFDKLTDAGLSNEQALDVAENIAGLGEDATTLEQYMAVARMPISEFEKELALEGIMTESAFAKYSTAREAGIDTYEYCNFLDTIDGYSGDGRQEQVWAYIDSLPLTSAQKDALHLAAGYKDTTLSKTPWHR